VGVDGSLGGRWGSGEKGCGLADSFPGSYRAGPRGTRDDGAGLGSRRRPRYLLGTADHVLPPAEQLFMAKRAHSDIVKANASHLSMLSQPRKAASLIIEAARTAG
jgi:pimeloyl-ACP methyl ester carboxylesterase